MKFKDGHLHFCLGTTSCTKPLHFFNVCSLKKNDHLHHFAFLLSKNFFLLHKTNRFIQANGTYNFLMVNNVYVLVNPSFGSINRNKMLV